MLPKSSEPRRSARHRPAQVTDDAEVGGAAVNEQPEHATGDNAAATDRRQQPDTATGPASSISIAQPGFPAAASSRAPSLRGQSSETRPRGLKFQPKTNVRRSKEQREAQDHAEAERQRRLAASTAAAQPRGGFVPGRGRGGRGMFRGGLSGWRHERSATASGFLGGPSEKEEPVSKGRRAEGGPTEAPASKEAVETDAEKGRKSPTSSRGGTSKSSKGKPGSEKASEAKSGKKEGDGEPEIKQEEPETFDLSEYAKDHGISIDDLLNVDSDGDTTGDNLVSTRERTPERPLDRPPNTSWMRPIRIGRHEHIERAKGVNTEASSARSAQLRRQAAHRSEDQEHADDPPQRSTTGRGKGKGKEVQFVRERKTKGVNLGENPPVKDEPKDVAMAEAPDPDTSGKGAGPSTKPSASDEPIDEDDDDVVEPSKRRRRRHPVFRPSRPALQTDEDHAEWDRRERDLQAVAEELGGASVMPQDAKSPRRAGTADSGAAAADQKQDLVYLFQLPPFLPHLVPEPDANATGDDATAMDVDRGHSPIPADVEQNLARDDEKKEPLDKAARIKGLTANGKAEFSGRVGTLTVYESGVSTLTWGGIEHELSRAPPNEMLQEVLVTDWPEKPEKKGSAKRDDKAGENKETEEKEAEESEKREPTAWSMGQIVGGFVATPNWISLFDATD